MKTKLPFFLIFALLFTFTGCEEENDPSPVEDLFFGNGDASSFAVALTTKSAEAIDAYSVRAEAEINTSLDAADLELGFCYKEGSGVPTYSSDSRKEADNQIIFATGEGNFSANITGLKGRTSYGVRAYARDSEGNIYYGNTTTATTPNPPPVVANFTFSPQSPKVGEEVTFQNQSTGATSYEWRFGDGGTSTGQNPKYTYSRTGRYTVQLITRNPTGQSDSESKVIEVVQPADASKLNGQWVGTYRCQQGITGMILTMNGNGERVSGVLDFYGIPQNPDNPYGSLEFEGTLDANRGLTIEGRRWIRRPQGYILIDFSGIVNQNFNQISGDVLGTGCNDFTVSKVNSINAAQLNGDWVGTYRCGQGDTGLTLSVTGEDQYLEAIFSFYATSSNPNVPSGSYRMRGVYNGQGTIDLEFVEWINRPSGFDHLNFEASVNLSTEEIRGTLCNRSFVLRRGGGSTNNINPTDYTATRYENLFLDNFSNNNNDWFEGENSDYTFDVRNGAYLLQSKNNQVWFVSRDIELNPNRNYDIEVEFRLLSGGENFGHGLRWGFSDVDNNFFFSLFPANREYSVGEQRSGSYSFWKGWTAHNAVRTSGWNRLTVRKYENQYYFFVNGQFVYSRSYVAPSNNRIAFAVPPRSAMEVDNLKVRYITN